MTVSPHIAQARAACLRAAVDTRTASELPAVTVARAQIFEAYVLGDNAEGADQPKPRKATAKAA